MRRKRLNIYGNRLKHNTMEAIANKHSLLGNRDSVLNLIRTTVRNSEPDASIILYGSRARGDAREDSDWDVVVLLNKPPMPHDERYAIAYDLWDKGQDIGEEINTLVYTKDQWDNAPPSLFKYNVREEGIQL